MNNDGDHVPNLIVADKVCVKCLEKWKVPTLHCPNNCGVKTFTNNDYFCFWLLLQEQFICLAHNLRAYDGISIMKYLATNRLPNDHSPTVNILHANSCQFNVQKLS